MQFLLLIAWLLFLVSSAFPQASSSSVEIVTVHSQNGKYFLKSTPYDDEFPTLRGRTEVYEKGKTEPLYAFDRGFDSVDEDSNNLFLTDNGETIFYLIPWGADEEVEGLKSVSIYKKGKLRHSFTASEITRCDLKKERCYLVYNNDEDVVDRDKSRFGSADYKKTFKSAVSEEEKFLSDYAVFAFDDVVYVTDSKKKTHAFDINGDFAPTSEPFTKLFPDLRTKGRINRVEIARYDSAIYLDLPKLMNGTSSELALAAAIGMRRVDISNTMDEQFKWYSMEVSGTVSRNGTFELGKLDTSAGLPKDKILEFFNVNRFDISEVPSPFPKWYIREQILFFRNKSDALAREEKRIEVARQKDELKKRLVAESIADRYIPKDLGDAFDQLDKELPEVDKKEMAALPKRDDMIKYHLGLGMWMRNNWELWGGSRLQKYFTDKGVTHPESMSSVILFYYWDWLQGKKDSWKDWEKNPKSVFDKE